MGLEGEGSRVVTEAITIAFKESYYFIIYLPGIKIVPESRYCEFSAFLDRTEHILAGISVSFKVIDSIPDEITENKE